MKDFEGCQLPCLPNVAIGQAKSDAQPLLIRLKRVLAKPWNYQAKPILKRWTKQYMEFRARGASESTGSEKHAPIDDTTRIYANDLVRVRSRTAIEDTLDSWNELKGCAFLDNMWQYCDTNQRVLRRMERFLDERDYKVKRCNGLILLEGVICEGTPVFGRCDRCCHLFWREEWLEKIDG